MVWIGTPLAKCACPDTAIGMTSPLPDIAPSTCDMLAFCSTIGIPSCAKTASG